MMHLSDGDLKTWYEQGRAEDRERVIGHLAQCDQCRRALAAIAAAAPALDGPVSVTVKEAVPMGYAARPGARAHSAWSAWLRPAYGLAAAAVVIVGVLWVTSPARNVDEDAIRSSELLALSPAGSTNVVEFKWESPLVAAKYRVVVRDAGGALVYTGETAASPLTVDAAVRSHWATMTEYTWTVSALDAAGEIIAESKPQTFRYQP